MRRFSGIRLRKAAIVPILALALVSTLAACGSAPTASGSANSSRTPTASTHFSACENSLEVLPAQSAQIAGHTRYLYIIGNVGSSPCTLKGYPVVTVDSPVFTVTTADSTDTWSHVAVDPITLDPITSVSGTPVTAPSNFAWFAIQGRDETTGCEGVRPTVAPSQDAEAQPLSAFINICGGELYVSPWVSSPQAFNR